MRFFNTAGPCVPERHYMLPPEPRLPEARPLVERGMYFVVHAPRQTGKTTTLRALARQLTVEGTHAALHFSCETGEPAGDNYAGAQDAVLAAMRREARALPPELRPPDPWPDAADEAKLSEALLTWALACPRPLVLFFDEIDALRGESLRSVLRQLRDGYPSAPEAFPTSVVLCGLRDVRDYKAAAGGDPDRLGTSSPFNIKVKSLRLRDFTEADVRTLMGQHTADTGQEFTEDALTRAWEYTQGQPWLVNALAREVVEEAQVPITEAITGEHIDAAKESLIFARVTHLDSLLSRLYEPRVRRILEPMIAGHTVGTDPALDDDLSYVRDLGLIARNLPIRIANPIYREVIVRVLGTSAEVNVLAEPRSFVSADGRLDIDRLLREFADFWRENGDILTSREEYHESAPHLVFMGFLQRLVNGGGYINREYGIGRGRVDLLVRWPYTDHDGHRAVQREAIELKVWHPRAKDPLPKALTQLDGYLRRLDVDHGTLVIFDRRPTAKSIDERTGFEAVETPDGRTVTLLRA
ncbi:MAG TPA: AAA family ATPase [Micromonosporaceae bacterium]|nr:AAA family ATPase [Micromonosporaceae bacterium]